MPTTDDQRAEYWDALRAKRVAPEPDADLTVPMALTFSPHTAASATETPKGDAHADHA